MSLTEKINQAIKQAMLAKERDKLAALRDIKSKLMNEATSGKGSLDEVAEDKIVIKLHKQRMETYELYKEQGRDDLAEEELFQAKIMEEYMPKMMSQEEIQVQVEKTIAALGASGPQDMGKVMGTLTKALGGKADGKTIADLVKKSLSKS